MLPRMVAHTFNQPSTPETEVRKISNIRLKKMQMKTRHFLYTGEIV